MYRRKYGLKAGIACIGVTLAAALMFALFPARLVAAGATPDETIPIVYFYTEGCSECHAVETLLAQLESRYPIEVIARYEALDETGARIRSALDDAYGTPAAQRGVAPTIFVGHHVLLRESDIRAHLEEIIMNSTAMDAQYLRATYAEATKASGGSQEMLFRGFGILTIVGAGLLDGVNPCAFATLIFFISYLMMRSKKKSDILLVGGAFAAGVFLAYFLAGLGLYKYVAQAKWFFAIAKWFYLVVGIFAVIIALLSLRDAWRTRHGRLDSMTLQLPSRSKNIIHSLIRRTANTGFLATSAFLVAFPVSLFEFLCTGQTYLPTIVFIYSQNALRMRATILLAIYNMMFVLPLIVVAVVAYLGATSERMVAWLNRNTTVVKMATALLFLTIGAYLLSRAFTLLGVI